MNKNLIDTFNVNRSLNTQNRFTSFINRTSTVIIGQKLKSTTDVVDITTGEKVRTTTNSHRRDKKKI